MDGCSNICGHMSKLEWLTTEMLFLGVGGPQKKAPIIPFITFECDQKGC